MKKLYLLILPFLLGQCKIGEMLHRSDALNESKVIYNMGYNNRWPSHKPISIHAVVYDMNTKRAQFNYNYSTISKTLIKFKYFDRGKPEKYTSISDLNNGIKDREVISLSRLDSLIIGKTIYFLDSLHMDNPDSLKKVRGFSITNLKSKGK
jgi:hypothetical protein